MNERVAMKYALSILILGLVSPVEGRRIGDDGLMGGGKPVPRPEDAKDWGSGSEDNKLTKDVDVWDGENLLCGVEDDGLEGRQERCAQRCFDAMADVELPPFPMYFFGGLTAKDRENEQSPITDLDATVEEDVIVVDPDRNFAYPMQMAAYFTCYTRAKWPLFNAWVVSPELQTGGNVRVGSFGNVAKDSEAHESFHAKYKGEILRSRDVKGVWSEYFSFDQGHWAPDAPFRADKDLVASTYYYINVSPQTACLNRQEWEHLESNVRDFAVKNKKKMSVMAGPLEELPEYFFDNDYKKKRWDSILEMWRVAGEVLMQGVDTMNGMKDPHWMEVTSRDQSEHCILRGYSKKEGGHLDVAVETKDYVKDLKDIEACRPKELLDHLDNYAFYLMTQTASTKAERRGVRVPLGYWKVVSWEDSDDDQVYCCWLMDQVGTVDTTNTGAACKREVRKTADIIPNRMKYAGDKTCSELFTVRGGDAPEEQAAHNTMDCDFHTSGIGWRGSYLLDEAGVSIDG